MTDERVARVYDVVEAGPGEFDVILGEGNGECCRWRVTQEQLRNATARALNIVMRNAKS